MLNNKFNRLHERCLQVTYSDNTSYFKELSETDNPVSVYHPNTQVPATELYKTMNRNSPGFMEAVFPFNENQLRSVHDL